jgi:hypothetical protein
MRLVGEVLLVTVGSGPNEQQNQTNALSPPIRAGSY